MKEDLAAGQRDRKPPGSALNADVRRDDVHVLRNRCPFCHDDLNVEEEVWIACSGCLARHHEACWTEGGACGSCGGAERLAPAHEGAVRLRAAASPRAESVTTPSLILAVFVVVFGATAAVYPSSFVVGLVGGLILTAPLFAVSAWMLDRRRARQKRAFEECRDAQNGWPSYPVCYASEERFLKSWKGNPWEGTGMLTLGPTLVTLTGETPAWERHYTPKEAVVEWIGQSFWINGFPYWFCISQGGERTYFTAEPGLTLIPSHGTRVIYERLVRSGRSV